MSTALPRFAGTTYLVTRKCIRGQFFLIPNKEFTALILYAIARAQKNCPVQIHSFCFMSNHLHMVMTDPDGLTGPKFMCEMDSFIAQLINKKLDQDGPIWNSAQRPNWCALTDENACWDKMVYTLVNPVKAGLVESNRLWPGAITTVKTLRKGIVKTKRPPLVFSGEDSEEQWRHLNIELTPFPGAAWMESEKYLRKLDDLVMAEEAKIVAERAKQNKGFMGAKRVQELPYTTFPLQGTNKDKKCKKGKKGSIRPKVAGSGSQAWLDVYEAFLGLYDKCREMVLDGIRNVEFPKGTYMMHAIWGFPVSSECPLKVLESHPLA